MTNLNLLFLTRKGDGYVGAPQTRHEFEQEVAKHCNCKFAGEGWPLYRANESTDMTVKRVMPDADWVIDKDDNLHNRKPSNRHYKVGLFISDLHGKHHYGVKTPVGFTDMINDADYDMIWMRYPLIYGTGHPPKVVYDGLTAKKRWVPWSVDVNKFHRRIKTVDVAFLGAVMQCYPLRQSIWGNINQVAQNYKVLRREAPRGKTYSRDIKSLTESHLVGEKYAKTLGGSRVLIFGCSIYRYPLQKYTQAGASMCCVLSNKPSMSKKLGLIDRKTYVEVNEDDWKTVLLYYLENEDEAEIISKNWFDVVSKNHTHKIRAKQFLKELSD